MAGFVALALADVANNIASGVSGLASALGLTKPDPKFPEVPAQGITSDFQRDHWYKTPSQGLYAFSVDKVGEGSVSEYPAFIDNIKSLFGNSDEGGFGEFKLPITPQEISQVEDFAVSIKPTQGGTVVNHSGNKYKTLVISGTTGVQPFRGLLGAYKGNGLAIGKPDELKYRSGYEVFQHFRQWMRAYHEYKTQPGSQPFCMVFRNYKDWEFLYVEPLKFTMKRDASKPLQYNYFIQLRVIGVHTIEKPLFDMVVSKLDELSATVLNTYALFKKNKPATEFYTGTVTDYMQSVNNLKYALKAANKQDITLAEFTKSDAEKLSFKEALVVLGQIGNAMGKDPKSAEQAGTSPASDDPGAKALGLTSLTPSTTTAAAVKAELFQLLDSEPDLLKDIATDDLPPTIKAGLLEKQKAAAKVSALEVANLQAQTISIGDKLADGLGLSDDTYDSVFGITSTVVDTPGEITDAQFEMLYALNEMENALDGILSSDEMFDTNATLFQEASSLNGANVAGVGVFSFPTPGGSTKEGYLPENTTLEDIALVELGDSARWTEIAELNNLKPPYIVDRDDILSPNYSISSANYSDPDDIRNLQVDQYYLIPSSPVPAGGWLGKGDYVARYNGGTHTEAESWNFAFPDEGTLVQDVSSAQFFKYDGSEWAEVYEEDYSQDGVLRPGDKLLIPSAAARPVITPLQGPRDNRFTNTLTNSERSLAVDLSVTPEMDLDLTPSGDLNVAYGSANGAQAIVLKLLYEKGSLKEFPSIGTNLTPGKKVPDIATLRADLVSSLLQDTRIKDVVKINITKDNGTVNLSFEVLFNDVQEPVPINIPI